MKVLVFDTETTGLPKTKMLNPLFSHLWPHIVQLSYVIYDTETNEVVKMQDFIIQMEEGFVISDESIKIHGITNEISRDKGVNITIALGSFFADGKTVDVLVAHNTQFDSDVIKMELLRIIEDKTRDHEAKDTYKDMLYHATYVFAFRCTMKETIDFCKIAVQGSYGKTYNKFPSLAELYYKLFQQKPENLHNALHDVLITLICFMQFNYRIKVVDVCPEIRKCVGHLGIL